MRPREMQFITRALAAAGRREAPPRPPSHRTLALQISTTTFVAVLTVVVSCWAFVAQQPGHRTTTDRGAVIAQASGQRPELPVAGEAPAPAPASSAPNPPSAQEPSAAPDAPAAAKGTRQRTEPATLTTSVPAPTVTPAAG